VKVTLNKAEIHIATGGRPLDPKQPAIVFLHGSGLDHRTWALQTRWFAFNGYAVVAPDFPGHSQSDGRPLTSIAKQADWLWTLLGRPLARRAGRTRGRFAPTGAHALAERDRLRPRRAGQRGTARHGEKQQARRG